MKIRNVFPILFMVSLPAVLLGVSTGPPIKRTAVPADGGLNCTACHRGMELNAGPGKVTIEASKYYPGRVHTIKVKVEDSTASKWGFQLTARMAGDQTKAAGVFVPSPDYRIRCDPDGRDVPLGSMNGCNGALEFAEHNRNATRPGTTGSRTFEVQWVAPGRNVGDVIFYAVGNGANNDSTNGGDHIYSTNGQFSAEDCEDRGPAPTVSGVSDAASGRAALSSNTIVSIYGNGFASSDDRYGAKRGDLLQGKVHTELACVAVEIGGQRVPVFYVQSNQINAQAPIIHGSGMVDVRVLYNPGGSSEKQVYSNTHTVAYQSYTPALFTFDVKSVAARNASTNYSIVANPAVVSTGTPAKPNDVVVLYGTGFGFTEPIWQPGEFSEGEARLKEPVKIMLGGVTIPDENILYAGLSPDAPGFYQFNIRLPESVPDGDIPVILSIGGVDTQAGTTLPVKR